MKVFLVISLLANMTLAGLLFAGYQELTKLTQSIAALERQAESGKSESELGQRAKEEAQTARDIAEQSLHQERTARQHAEQAAMAAKVEEMKAKEHAEMARMAEMVSQQARHELEKQVKEIATLKSEIEQLKSRAATAGPKAP
ncbi:MAG: hypothetical protein SGI77_21445 [Pirellulaceae bacterium]|nr:hypothetical protein [Pirellulaceae bacterium]